MEQMQQDVLDFAASAIENYDAKRFDEIWQRILPDLDPYPNMRTTSAAPNTEKAVVENVNVAAGSEEVVAEKAAEKVKAVSEKTALNVEGAVKAESAKASSEAEPVTATVETLFAMEVCGFEPCPTEGAKLLSFIEGAVIDSQYYIALARCGCSPNIKNKLVAISCEKMRQAKRLSAAYFVLEGVRACRPKCGYLPVIACFSDELRQRYLTETERAQQFLSLSQNMEEGFLKELYLDLYYENTAHARCVMSILSRMG